MKHHICWYVAPSGIQATILLFLSVILFIFGGFANAQEAYAFSILWTFYCVYSFAAGCILFRFIRPYTDGWNLVFAGYAVLHAYLWGFWGWYTKETFTPEWWFDTAGHFLFFVILILALVRVGIPFVLSSYRHSPRTTRYILDIMLIIIIAPALAALWECVEYGIDWINGRHPNYMLQKDNDDTMWDVYASLLGALLAVLMRRLYDWYLKHKYPEVAEEDSYDISRIRYGRELIRDAYKNIRTRHKDRSMVRGVRRWIQREFRNLS